MKSIEAIREDFPILQEKIYDKPLIYLDNGATTQMPRRVMDCWMHHFMHQNANVHRGIHFLSEQSTLAMERARKETAAFLHAASEDEIVFTCGATDSLNMVAAGFARPQLCPGKKVIVTELEHHSNYVPWQQAAKEKGASFVVIPMKDDLIDMDALGRELDQDTVMLAVTAVSNVTGVKLPLERIIEMAHAKNVPVCIDASQAMRHGEMDVSKLDCEFLAFSAHKMMGSTGVGVLYGKKSFLEQMRPVRFGGGMVDIVGTEDTSFAAPPYCFEAGTPNYPGVIAFGETLVYLSELGLADIAKREDQLTLYLENTLDQLDGVTVIAKGKQKNSVVAISVDGVHPYDLASILDKYGIAQRSGNHCAQPLLRKLGYESLMRFSPAFYNTEEEMDYLGECMTKAIQMLRRWK